MRGISDHFGIVSDMRVAIAPVNGCFTSGLTTLLDVLQTAEGMRRSLNAEIPSIDVEIGGFSDTVVTRNGLSADVSRRFDREGCAGLDVLVVPSLGAGASADALEHALVREDIHRLIDVLREGPLPPVVAAACSGTFVLAQAGLLDGHMATTSWFLRGTFQRRYPRVGLDMSRMVVRSGAFITAGAGFAHIDLALSLVSGLSRELASMVASRPAAHRFRDLGPDPPVGADQDLRRRRRPRHHAEDARAPRPGTGAHDAARHRPADPDRAGGPPPPHDQPEHDADRPGRRLPQRLHPPRADPLRDALAQGTSC
jgi:transcriptional regulator GlxA family with amidase domain